MIICCVGGRGRGFSEVGFSVHMCMCVCVCDSECVRVCEMRGVEVTGERELI